MPAAKKPVVADEPEVITPDEDAPEADEPESDPEAPEVEDVEPEAERDEVVVAPHRFGLTDADKQQGGKVPAAGITVETDAEKQHKKRP